MHAPDYRPFQSPVWEQGHHIHNTNNSDDNIRLDANSSVDNADIDAKVTWLYDEKAVTFISEGGASSGEELFNNYGPKSNEELLMNYGFAEDDIDLI